MIASPVETRPEGGELRETLRLAGPLALASAGSQLLSVTDVFVAGHLGERALAAVGLGHSVFFIIAIFPIGVMLGLDPLVAQALGRGEPDATHRYYAGARRLATRLTAPVICGMVLLLAISLATVDFAPETARASWLYLLARVASVWPLLILNARRSMLQAWGRTGAIAGAMVVGNLLNLPLSALLSMGDGVFVELGLPAPGIGEGLGPMGIGLATVAVCFAQMAWLGRGMRRLPEPPADAEPAPMGPVWRLGWPVGLQYGAEVSIFAGTTIVMGLFGEAALAAHQIALNITSLTFTLSLGISAATSVRVGLPFGRLDMRRARRAAQTGLGVGVAVMMCTATAFALEGRAITGLFTDVEPIVEQAAGFLLIAAVFQLLDGMQAIAAGGLRGAGDTRAAMLIGMVGYWIVGFPTALGLGLGAEWGPPGLWYGLVAGLAFSGPVLSGRLMWITRSR